MKFKNIKVGDIVYIAPASLGDEVFYLPHTVTAATSIYFKVGGKLSFGVNNGKSASALIGDAMKLGEIDNQGNVVKDQTKEYDEYLKRVEIVSDIRDALYELYPITNNRDFLTIDSIDLKLILGSLKNAQKIYELCKN